MYTIKLTKKQRIKLLSRSVTFSHMHPHVFNKLCDIFPYFMYGVNVPNHYG